MRCAWKQRLEIHGKSLSKVLRRCYDSGGMASGPPAPASEVGAQNRAEEGRRAPWGPGDGTSLPPAESGPLSPGRRRLAVVGSGENSGTRPSHSLPQPHPLTEGGSKVLAAAMVVPCQAAPGPTTPTANRLGVSGASDAEPAAPAGRGRYPESLCRPRRRRTLPAGPGRAAGGGREKTDSVATSLPA